MDEISTTPGALPLLAELFRSRQSGLLTLGSGPGELRVLLHEGQVAGLGPVAGTTAARRTDEPAAVRLERVLQEVGLRKASPAPPRPAPAPEGGLRERALDALVEPGLPAVFAEGAPRPPDVAEVAGATEPLILEAIRRLRGKGVVEALLGDLDRRLSATAGLLDERTLTLTEGYILSRIDGSATVREVLQLVPLDPDETQRTLLGLLLTGRVKARPVLTPRTAEDPARESAMPGRGEGDPTTAVPAAPPPALDPEEPVRAVSVGDGASAPIRSEAVGSPAVEADPASREERPAEATPAALDSETLARRREIVELFQSLPLKNHFEVLGVEPGCADADVRRAYAGLAKRFHPDAHRDPRLADLHDLLEAVFIRVGEAREVLGDATSRASYEARLGVVRRTSPETGRPAGSPAPPPPADEYAYVPPEETLLNAQLLLAQARYWDAIQMLETAIPQMEPSRYRMRGRILLARAYAKNPNWLRKAQEQLQEVVRTDPTNVDAHYELGMLYKAGGLPARAQTMFRRVLELRPDHRESLAELAAGDARGGGLLKKLFGRGQAS